MNSVKVSEGARSLACFLKRIRSLGVVWGTFVAFEKPLKECIITNDLSWWRFKPAAAFKSVNGVVLSGFAVGT